MQPPARFLNDLRCPVDLFLGWHQGGAVLQRPAVVLHIGDLQPLGIEGHSHLDNLGQLVQVLPVHHGVDGERQPKLARPAGGFELLSMAAPVTADTISKLSFAALKADLNVRETRIPELGKAVARQQHG